MRCEDHYKPKGPDDLVPADPVSIAVALADKFDILVSFWSIDEKPTGSKDPYALRRAALGVIRIVLDNAIRLPLLATFGRFLAPGPSSDLLAFFADRLKVQLREQGARHDLVDAVFSLAGQDDLLLIARRVEALGKFLDTEDGKNLLAGTKRAANILRIEEKRDGTDVHRRARPAALCAGRGAGARQGDRRRQGAKPRRRSRARTSRPPCARWRSCGRTSTRSSTR